MSWYYTYGFLAGGVSIIGYQIHWVIGILLTICFGLIGWITDIIGKEKSNGI